MQFIIVSVIKSHWGPVVCWKSLTGQTRAGIDLSPSLPMFPVKEAIMHCWKSLPYSDMGPWPAICLSGICLATQPSLGVILAITNYSPEQLRCMTSKHFSILGCWKASRHPSYIKPVTPSSWLSSHPPLIFSSLAIKQLFWFVCFISLLIPENAD